MKLGSRICLAALLSTAAASGAVIVSASASGGDAGYVSISGQSADFGGANHLHASATSSGNTLLATGSAPGCSPNCVALPHGWGYAEADGATGRLKASGGAYDVVGGGDGNATILDTITFLSSNRQIKVTLDGSILASNEPGASAGMQFTIFLQDPDGPGEQVEQPIFEIYAYEQDGDRYHSVNYFLGEMDGEGYFVGIPPLFEYTFELPFFPFPYDLGFSLTAGGGCDFGPTCSAQANFFNTAYLGIEGEYISANGYSYPGAPPDSAIPEPQSWTLAALGLTALTLIRRRSYSSASNAPAATGASSWLGPFSRNSSPKM